MTWAQQHSIIDVIDLVPQKTRLVKKQIWNGQDFEDRLLCHIYLSQKDPERAELETWLRDTYGPARPHVGLWWSTIECVVVQDKVYTFYSLRRKTT